MRQTLLVGWIAFVLLAIAASPAHFWLDSGELGAAGFELGVMHPPGTPGYALLLRLVAALPIGSIGFRLSLASSVLGAIAVALVHAILVRREAEGWVAWGACAWVLAGWTFARHGRVVEIYALGAVLLLVAIWGFDPHRRGSVSTQSRRAIGLLAAVWGAWAFGDLRLALVPAVGVGWWIALRNGQPWARWAPLLVVMTSAVAMALPMASARSPIHDWGAPRTWDAFLDHVFARTIRTAFREEIWPASWPMWGLNARALGRQLLEDLGPLGPLAGAVALLGLWRGASRDRASALAALGLTWVAGIEVLYAVGINPMGIEDRQTGLVLAPLAALAVGDGMRRAFEARPRWRFAVGPLCWIVLCVPPLASSVPDALQTRSWGPHAWVRATLAQLPTGSLVLTQSDDLSAGLGMAQTLEGARPDVIVLVAQHLDRPAPPRGDAARSALWRAAARGKDEAERIEAVIEAHRGPVAVEAPTHGVFGGVAFWSQYGDLPLRIRDPQDRVPIAQSPQEAARRWLSRLDGPDDRKRLAIALANDARARVRQGENLETAVRSLRLVVDTVRPEHASAWVTLAALADRRGETGAAVEMTRYALRLEPGRAVAMTNLALYLSRDPSTFPEALQWAQRAIALRPHDPGGWQRLAQLREQAGDAEGARAAAQRAKELAP